MSEETRRRIMVSFRVTPDLKAAIDEEAAREGLTVTDFIIFVLEAYLSTRPAPSETEREVEPDFFG